MKKYIGTKIVNAKPMNRADYNIFRGWQLLDNENGADEGYLVEYLDGGVPNTSAYNGYVSWSPKVQFEKAYVEPTALDFSETLVAIKQGMRLARNGWNGKGMYVRIVNDLTIIDDLNEKLEPILIIVNGSRLNTWIPSISDLLANDWYIFGE